jgi:hypothetical protein
MFGSFLNFEAFGTGGEHLIAGFGDEDGVFDANAAEFMIVETGLDGDDVSGAQFFVYRR